MKLCLIATLFFLPFSTFADAPVKVITKKNVQTKTKTCSASRTYIELEDMSDVTVMNKINDRIRKQMTVGKKLKDSDCDNGDDPENYEYVNRATLTGQRSGKLGVEYLVYFPGGSGRTSITCETFDLKTGKTFDVSKCVNAEGLKKLSKDICDQAKKDASTPMDEYSQKFFCAEPMVGSVMCLSDTGIHVMVSGNWKMIQGDADISTADLAKYTKKECAL